MLSLVHTASQSCCQPWKDSYNTNSPRTSLMTIESICTCVCVLLCILAAVTTQEGRLFRSVLLIVWLLLEGGDYSKKYGKYSVVCCVFRPSSQSCIIIPLWRVRLMHFVDTWIIYQAIMSPTFDYMKYKLSSKLCMLQFQFEKLKPIMKQLDLTNIAGIFIFHEVL